eukprot:scaffold2134_cov93-Cylindrotheca_fusiformis.AAC.8
MYSKRHTLIKDRKRENTAVVDVDSLEQSIVNAVCENPKMDHLDEDVIRAIVRKIMQEEGPQQNDTPSPSHVKVTAKTSSLEDSHYMKIKPNRVTNRKFDATVKRIFPGAIDNYALVKHVTSILFEEKGYTKSSTLLATSLCCDEASRQLEDDFEEAYGRNFNLGGLAGFPWAGQTGFAAMAHHIPDHEQEDSHCLLVYGPHVGITQEGIIGKVERAGIGHPDTCCGSAVAASRWVEQITNGEALITTNLQEFTDFQQGAVQQMMLPHCRRLDDAGEDRMKHLPYAMYDSQDLLMRKITERGAASTRNGLVLLGGVQINTGPTTPDYFHPLRFCFMNRDGDIVEDYIPELYNRIGVVLDADGNVGNNRRSFFAAARPSTVLTTPKGEEGSKKTESEGMKIHSSASEPDGSHRQTKSIWGGAKNVQIPDEFGELTDDEEGEEGRNDVGVDP